MVKTERDFTLKDSEVIRLTDCPVKFCSAKIGEYCKSRKGTAASRTHNDRYFKAGSIKRLNEWNHSKEQEKQSAPEGLHDVRNHAETIDVGYGPVPVVLPVETSPEAVQDVRREQLEKAFGPGAEVFASRVTGVEGIEGMQLRLRRIDAIRGGLRMVHSLYGLDFLINKIAEGIVDNAEWLKG